MAERGQQLQPTTLASRLLREGRNCGWYLENLPSKCLTKHSSLKLPGSLDSSRRWVFVREGLEDCRKGWPRYQGLKDAFLPHIHHRAPNVTPKKRQRGLPKEATLLPRLAKAEKAFLENVEASMALHPLALYPHLQEALPAELLLHVLEVLDPERKLRDMWAYCQDTRELMKEPTKLVETCSPQECLPEKTLVSHSGQWLCEEKPSTVDSLHKDSLLHGDVHRRVNDFCNWASALGSSSVDEEFILQQFDVGYQTRRSCNALHMRRLNQDKPFIRGRPSVRERCGCWNKPQSSTGANPHKPKQEKTRYGARYLNTNLWKKQRADKPLVDPKISHNAQDTSFKKQLRDQGELLAGLQGTAAFKSFILSRGYRMPKFLEKIYDAEKGKSESIKAPKTPTQTERNPGRR
ncbi:protein FAM47E isoform X1 [Acomys russatus]|uniref:protein FAM47E isoform X1 n=1 Tax=Acomys russatus TaxID=60746 RepID=UPI0021E22E3B|nr:protein FAM47E isoform X1 [Acomys russatus]